MILVGFGFGFRGGWYYFCLVSSWDTQQGQFHFQPLYLLFKVSHVMMNGVTTVVLVVVVVVVTLFG